MTGVRAISAGWLYSLFLKNDGTVWAAGYNAEGELGDGTTANRSTPVQVMVGVQAISAGNTQSLFLKANGTVWASGYNGQGSLGDGTNQTRLTPVQVITGVNAISAGNSHSLFLKTDNTVWATGYNNDCELGDGTTANRSTPVQILTQVQAISAGNSHSLFLKTDNTVWATGYNYSGGLGDGTTVARATPVQVILSSAPTIITQPSSQSVNYNTSATFTIVATGMPSPTYEWYLDGSLLAGATSATLTVGATQAADLGSYSCIVTNASGSVTSSSAILTVNTLPVITTPPPSPVFASSNQTVSLSLTATGTPTPTYQWLKNSVLIPGATSATLSLSSVQLTSAGNYQCVVANSVGSVTSAPSSLTVYAEPDLTTRVHPVAQDCTVGNTVTFSAAATSIQPITYQWLKNGSVIPGATSATYAIGSAAAGDAGSYQCRFNDADEIVTSNAAVLTVYTDTALAIRTQPTPQVVVLGKATTFSLGATSAEPIAYQWRKNGVSISGATSASYTIPVVGTGDAGNYTCIVSDDDELLLSTVASLTVQVAPAISSQPVSSTVLQGMGASFAVTASGTPAPTYQWRRNNETISGATSATYTIASALPADAGSYTCVVSNAAGSVTSAAATLTVNVPATIAASPTPAMVYAGGSATLSITATGTPTLSYQWKKNGELITGATGSSLSLSDVRYLSEADYSCVVANAYGTTESTAASLTVTVNPTSPDSDGDGLSDSLETYLSVFGLNPAKNSTKEWVRLLAMIPDLGAYYTADQMRGLALSQPVLQRAANGNFLLSLKVLESTNLKDWSARSLTPTAISTVNGGIQVELAPLNATTQFYRLEAQPTP